MFARAIQRLSAVFMFLFLLSNCSFSYVESVTSRKNGHSQKHWSSSVDIRILQSSQMNLTSIPSSINPPTARPTQKPSLRLDSHLTPSPSIQAISAPTTFEPSAIPSKVLSAPPSSSPTNYRTLTPSVSSSEAGKSIVSDTSKFILVRLNGLNSEFTSDQVVLQFEYITSLHVLGYWNTESHIRLFDIKTEVIQSAKSDGGNMQVEVLFTQTVTSFSGINLDDVVTHPLQSQENRNKYIQQLKNANPSFFSSLEFTVPPSISKNKPIIGLSGTQTPNPNQILVETLSPSYAPSIDTFRMGDDGYNLDFEITLPIETSSQKPSASPSQILTPAPTTLAISENPSSVPTNRKTPTPSVSSMPTTRPTAPLVSEKSKFILIGLNGLNSELSSNELVEEFEYITSRHVSQYWNKTSSDIILFDVKTEFLQSTVSMHDDSIFQLEILFTQTITSFSGLNLDSIVKDPFQSEENRNKYIQQLKNANPSFFSEVNYVDRAFTFENRPSLGPIDFQTPIPTHNVVQTFLPSQAPSYDTLRSVGGDFTLPPFETVPPPTPRSEDQTVNSPSSFSPVTPTASRTMSPSSRSKNVIPAPPKNEETELPASADSTGSNMTGVLLMTAMGLLFVAGGVLVMFLLKRKKRNQKNKILFIPEDEVEYEKDFGVKEESQHDKQKCIQWKEDIIHVHEISEPAFENEIEHHSQLMCGGSIGYECCLENNEDMTKSIDLSATGDTNRSLFSRSSMLKVDDIDDF